MLGVKHGKQKPNYPSSILKTHKSQGEKWPLGVAPPSSNARWCAHCNIRCGVCLLQRSPTVTPSNGDKSNKWNGLRKRVDFKPAAHPSPHYDSGQLCHNLRRTSGRVINKLQNCFGAIRCQKSISRTMRQVSSL